MTLISIKSWFSLNICKKLKGVQTPFIALTHTFAKEKEYFAAKVGLCVYFYNFIRPHRSLSKNPDKTRTPRTPALCAGITAKVRDIKCAFEIPCIDDN
jgi:hypothetical protein